MERQSDEDEDSAEKRREDRIRAENQRKYKEEVIEEMEYDLDEDDSEDALPGDTNGTEMPKENYNSRHKEYWFWDTVLRLTVLPVANHEEYEHRHHDDKQNVTVYIGDRSLNRIGLGLETPALRGVKVKSVSYTHLTLPTIYSV